VPSKPITLWLASQNGLRFEAPQRRGNALADRELDQRAGVIGQDKRGRVFGRDEQGTIVLDLYWQGRHRDPAG
jgi:hypothetical protein